MQIPLAPSFIKQAGLKKLRGPWPKKPALLSVPSAIDGSHRTISQPISRRSFLESLIRGTPSYFSLQPATYFCPVAMGTRDWKGAARNAFFLNSASTKWRRPPSPVFHRRPRVWFSLWWDYSVYWPQRPGWLGGKGRSWFLWGGFFIPILGSQGALGHAFWSPSPGLKVNKSVIFEHLSCQENLLSRSFSSSYFSIFIPGRKEKQSANSAYERNIVDFFLSRK